ncbi:MAG: HAD family hydrolase [bacterium]|nr:HAD family hydrolase [bacterium]
MKPKAIFFDLDNTLYDHYSSAAEAMRIMYERFRINDFGISLADFKDEYGTITVRLWLDLAPGRIDIRRLRIQRFEELFAHFGIDGISAQCFGEEYIDTYIEQHHPMQGVDSFLKSLSEKYPLGLLTNAFPDTQRKKLERLKWDDYFRWTLIAGEIGLFKPDPNLFVYIAELANADPGEMLYVGDSVVEDIEPAQKAGMITVWVRQPGVAKPDCNYVVDRAVEVGELVS